MKGIVTFPGNVLHGKTCDLTEENGLVHRSFYLGDGYVARCRIGDIDYELWLPAHQICLIAEELAA